MTPKALAKITDPKKLRKIAKNAGKRAVTDLWHAGLPVTGMVGDMIVSHRIDCMAISKKAKHREFEGKPFKLSLSHNHKVMMLILSGSKDKLMADGTIVFSTKHGVMLKHMVSVQLPESK